jgi:hypothetical protein
MEIKTSSDAGSTKRAACRGRDFHGIRSSGLHIYDGHMDVKPDKPPRAARRCMSAAPSRPFSSSEQTLADGMA